MRKEIARYSFTTHVSATECSTTAYARFVLTAIFVDCCGYETRKSDRGWILFDADSSHQKKTRHKAGPVQQGGIVPLPGHENGISNTMPPIYNRHFRSQEGGHLTDLVLFFDEDGKYVSLMCGW